MQIEGKEGAENINEIIAVPGIDVIFIGPYDLSQSLSLPGQIWHERVINEITRVIDVCRKAGITTGVFTDTEEGIKYWSSRGVKYLNYRLDVEMFLGCVRIHVDNVKKYL